MVVIAAFQLEYSSSVHRKCLQFPGVCDSSSHQHYDCKVLALSTCFCYHSHDFSLTIWASSFQPATAWLPWAAWALFCSFINLFLLHYGTSFLAFSKSLLYWGEISMERTVSFSIKEVNFIRTGTTAPAFLCYIPVHFSFCIKIIKDLPCFLFSVVLRKLYVYSHND